MSHLGFIDEEDCKAVFCLADGGTSTAHRPAIPRMQSGTPELLLEPLIAVLEEMTAELSAPSSRLDLPAAANCLRHAIGDIRQLQEMLHKT